MYYIHTLKCITKPLLSTLPHIDLGGENLTVFGSCKVLGERILLHIFYMMHFMSRVDKEAQSLSHMQYLMYTHVSILFIKGCQIFRNYMCDVTHHNSGRAGQEDHHE